MFETELKIFGVVNGDKTSRADGMLLQWKKYPNEIQYHHSLNQFTFYQLSLK